MYALNWMKKDEVIVVYFNDAKLLAEARLQQTGKELMELAEEVSTTESKKMLLNFQGVQVMASAMMGKLVLLTKFAQARGIELKFCDVSPNLLEPFKITRLTKLIGRFDDDDPATAGSFARQYQPPDNGDGRALPEAPDAEIE